MPEVSHEDRDKSQIAREVPITHGSVTVTIRTAAYDGEAMAAGRSGRAEMTRMNIDIDEAALMTAARALGTAGDDETVNEALRVAAVAAEERLRAYRELRDLAASGALDLDAVKDAWRPRDS
jgi:Arc/MetJ family transcription regulator